MPLKDILESAVRKAASNPEEFVEDVKVTGKKVGSVVEEVYSQLRQNPKITQQVVRNTIVQGVAKRIIAEFMPEREPKP